MENNGLAKSNTMPELQVIQYYQRYKITDLFVKDLRITLADLAYVDARGFFDDIETRQSVMTAAELDEFIKRLGNLPYRIVSRLMAVIYNKDNFLKYFEPLPIEDPNKIKTT